MTHRVAQIVNRIGPHLPGWLYLVSGAALIAIMMLITVWRDLCPLIWQRDVLALQSQSVARHAQAFEQFYLALESEDPVLLESLAYHHLRLKPAGCAVIQTANSKSWRHAITGLDLSGSASAPTPVTDGFSLEQRFIDAVAMTDPQSARASWPGSSAWARYQPVQSTLMSIATGWRRIFVLSFGMVLLIAGLICTPNPAVARSVPSVEE